jgi:Flp pilus assembly protein TadG
MMSSFGSNRPEVHRSRRKATRSEDGVAVVEAALVLPILFLFLLCLFEGGLWFRDDLSTGYVARDGIRVLSTLGADLTADQAAMRAAYKAASALRAGGQSIDSITIYRATCAGTAPCTTAASPITSVSGIGSATCTTIPATMSDGVTGVCNVYNPKAGLTSAIIANPAYWGCTATVAGITPIDRFWCPGSRKTALTDYGGKGPDYIGIRVQVSHRSITGLLPTTRTLVSETIFRIEAQS